MTTYATPALTALADAGPDLRAALFDEFAEAAIGDVRRSFPAMSPVVVADLVRAYRPFAFTPKQTAHACKQRLHEALSF